MEVYDEKSIQLKNLEKRIKQKVTLYERSQVSLGSCTLAMVRAGNKRYLVANGSGPVFDSLEGEVEQSCKICPTNHTNRLVLNTYFPFTQPVANTGKRPSIGLGDRLGEATKGHIMALHGSNVFPVFAQQSIRELTFTHRTFDQVIDCASYAVFQEGFTSGYGADGDHLKTSEEVALALAAGVSMITLDSSEQIDNSIQTMSVPDIDIAYTHLEQEKRDFFEHLYENQLFSVGEETLKLDRNQLRSDILTYHKALDHIEMIWNQHIKRAKNAIDFEISIDETATATNPKSHLFIALELKRRKILISTLAPRFVGEFQKGIDYRGDISLFEEDLKQHVAIAESFRYRLSIHSGSDKFSIFPILGACISGSFHIKTAGTNWLEAVRLVAQKDPELYRRLHEHSRRRFSDACAFYHVTTDIEAIEKLETVSDEKLPAFLDDDNARQMLHITYGYLLEDEDENGNKRFKDELFNLLAQEELAYARLLENHIGKHLKLLGFK